MKKRVFWNYEGKEFEGTATLNKEEGYISIMANHNGMVFDRLDREQIENDMSLEEIFNDIPEDITDFELC